MAFKNSIEDVNSKWWSLLVYVGGNVAAALVAYFGVTNTVTTAAVIAGLKVLGFAYLANAVDTIVTRMNSYARSCRTDQDKFNAA